MGEDQRAARLKAVGGGAEDVGLAGAGGVDDQARRASAEACKDALDGLGLVVLEDDAVQRCTPQPGADSRLYSKA